MVLRDRNHNVAGYEAMGLQMGVVDESGQNMEVMCGMRRVLAILGSHHVNLRATMLAKITRD